MPPLIPAPWGGWDMDVSGLTMDAWQIRVGYRHPTVPQMQLKELSGSPSILSCGLRPSWPHPSPYGGCEHRELPRPRGGGLAGGITSMEQLGCHDPISTANVPVAEQGWLLGTAKPSGRVSLYTSTLLEPGAHLQPCWPMRCVGARSSRCLPSARPGGGCGNSFALGETLLVFIIAWVPAERAGMGRRCRHRRNAVEGGGRSAVTPGSAAPRRRPAWRGWAAMG